MTPLHYAAVIGHSEVVCLLLDRGADIEAKAEVCTDAIFVLLFPANRMLL
jgi:ankyrin repeat protein